MELSQYFAVIKFAKEVLRTPINCITGIPFFIKCQEQHASFAFGELYPTMPPLIEKRGISTVCGDFYDNGQYSLWIGQRGELFKIEGDYEAGITCILRYYRLGRGKNNLTGMYYRGEAKYFSFEVYGLDALIEHKDKTLFELPLPPSAW